MPSIEINSNNGGMKVILNDVSNMETSTLETFLKEVAHLLVQRKVKSISKRETQLLLQINKPLLSSKSLLLYDLLNQKLKEETISKEEHTKLLRLIKKREKKGVERLAALIELSQLKKIAPKELMKQMGLSTLSYA